jgi:hypothetical protein
MIEARLDDSMLLLLGSGQIVPQLLDERVPSEDERYFGCLAALVDLFARHETSPGQQA